MTDAILRGRLGICISVLAVWGAVLAAELPGGYTPLAYIESTGLEQIDTELNAGAQTTVDMRFGRVSPFPDSVLFGKDVWNPKGFLLVVQNGRFRFFGNERKPSGEAKAPVDPWSLAGADRSESLDYRFSLGADGVARLTVGDETRAHELKVDRACSSDDSLKLFGSTGGEHGRGGVYRLYALKLGNDAGEALRDFVPCASPSGEVGLWDRVTGRFFGNVSGRGAFFGSTKAAPWSLERAQAWGRANPWYCGFNHVPANAINDVEVWQKETFSPEVIRKEFKLAAGLGFNCVRIFLQYKVYEDDPAWFLSAFEKYLSLADEAKLKVMPVLFDDCMFGSALNPTLGKQTEPYPGWYMWGWVPSPGRDMVLDARTHGKLEAFVKDLIGRHRADRRILLWDLYNEPTNGYVDKDRSIPLVVKCFAWARTVDPEQPLSVALWNDNKKLNDVLIRENDVFTFHCYHGARETERRIREFSAYGRPLICTEWMSRKDDRPGGCTIRDCLGLYKSAGVGCMMWGLVNGKTQVHLPFGSRPGDKVHRGPWKHDIFHSDHTPYDPAENELIRQATRDTSLPAFPSLPFGVTKFGEKATVYLLRGKGGLMMEVTDYGGRVSRLLVPDAKGALADVTIGFDSPKAWEDTDPFFGTIIGRYGNRIWQGRFTLDGKDYQLDCNDVTRDCHLHGGTRGWYTYVWKAEPFARGDDVGIVFTKRFPDGEQGFPGNVDAKVTYTITPDNTWRIEYEATTDRPTPMNLTHHVYFNMNGTGDVYDQELQIDADSYISVDEKLNPLPGAPKPVAGTPFDFRTFRKIGERINDPDRDLRIDPGYDHNFCLNGTGFRKVAEMRGDLRRMEVWTDQPGVQFYSGNLTNPQWTMKDGLRMMPRSHIALETQHYPNTPNRPDYPQATLRPGETYRTVTEYRFRAR